jgi:DNA-binding MarR family transcriptional regulator
MKPSTARADGLGGLVVEVFRLNGAFLMEGDRMTQDLGMSSARWQVLGALELAGRPLSASQVARNMGLTRQSVQRVLDELEASGFVTFADNPDHARAKLVAPTASGRRVFQTIMRRQSDWSNDVKARTGFSDRRLHDVTVALRKLREAIKGE